MELRVETELDTFFDTVENSNSSKLNIDLLKNEQNLQVLFMIILLKIHFKRRIIKPVKIINQIIIKKNKKNKVTNSIK